jgi:formamidopyrimidine-DNA glycosylase
MIWWLNLSVEFPEAYILAKQMNIELTGKQIATCNLQNCAKLQNLGFINIYLSDFDRLINRKIESTISRGNTIRLKLNGNLNLLLAPEYGGVILFHPKGGVVPSKYHLKLDFKDKTALTITLTGMGIIQALTDEELQHSYVYRRDFSQTASPMEEDFTFERFSKELTDRNVNLKTVIVGKEAAIVGLGNAAFQDILYHASIQPKHKTSDLNPARQRVLYDAIKFVIEQRIKLGGKSQFVDFYGKQGTYVAAMGSNMKGKICLHCGGSIEKLSLGGGQVYCCPNCQT